MTRYDEIADAIIAMEGSMLPGSVNMTMVQRHGLWNVGHLVWAGQRGAVPVSINNRLWAGWPSYEEARAGLIRQIQLDASRGLTLEQFITKYAPPSENQTSNYVAFVSQRTGIPPSGVMIEYLQPQYASVPPLGFGVETQDSELDAEAAGVGGAAAIAIAAAAGAIVLLRRQ